MNITAAGCSLKMHHPPGQASWAGSDPGFGATNSSRTLGPKLLAGRNWASSMTSRGSLSSSVDGDDHRIYLAGGHGV